MTAQLKHMGYDNII